jgi:hypothetical protein
MKKIKNLFFVLLISLSAISHAKKLNDIIDPTDGVTPMVLTDDACPDQVALKQNYNWIYIRNNQIGCYGDNGKDGPALVLFFIKTADGSYAKSRYNYQQLAGAIERNNQSNMAGSAWALEHPLTYPSQPQPQQQSQYNWSAPPPPMQIIQPTVTNQNKMTCMPNGMGGFNCK